jgi:hypothetical protein
MLAVGALSFGFAIVAAFFAFAYRPVRPRDFIAQGLDDDDDNVVELAVYRLLRRVA